MKKFLFYKEKHLLLINFDVLFESIEVDCLNELQEYGLVNNYQINLSKKDTKKIIYHHVIHGLCEEIRNNKHKYKKVIVVPPVLRSFHEITQFCHPEDLEELLRALIKRLNNSLPFVIYTAKDYIFEQEDIHTGEMEDLTSILSTLCTTFSDKRFTFEKIKRFSEQFDLNFLSKDYFNSIKTTLRLH